MGRDQRLEEGEPLAVLSAPLRERFELCGAVDWGDRSRRSVSFSARAKRGKLV